MPVDEVDTLVKYTSANPVTEGGLLLHEPAHDEMSATGTVTRSGSFEAMEGELEPLQRLAGV
jgi:hypothetical protein